MFGCVGEGRRRESLSSTLTNSSPSDQQRPLLPEMQNSDEGGTNARTYAELRIRERESTRAEAGHLSWRRHVQVERSHESDTLEMAAVDHTEANPTIQPSTSLSASRYAHPDGSCLPDESIGQENNPEIESPPAHIVISLYCDVTASRHVSLLQMLMERGIAADRRGWEVVAEDLLSSLTVTPALLLIKKNGDPGSLHDKRRTRAALETKDKRLNGQRVSLWTIGKAAVLCLVIEQPEPYCTPINVEGVFIKREDGRFHSFDFEDEIISPLTSVIRVPLSASIIQSPGLAIPRLPNGEFCPGYVELEFRVQIRIANDQTTAHEMPGTLYCKAEKKNVIHILRHIVPIYQGMKQRMPQSARDFSRSFFA